MYRIYRCWIDHTDNIEPHYLRGERLVLAIGESQGDGMTNAMHDYARILGVPNNDMVLAEHIMDVPELH